MGDSIDCNRINSHNNDKAKRKSRLVVVEIQNKSNRNKSKDNHNKSDEPGTEVGEKKIQIITSK